MKKIITLIILIIIGVGAWYWGTVTQPAHTTPQDPNLAGGSMLAGTSVPLEGTEFRLAQYNGVATPDDSAYTLVFQDGRLAARFCNQMGGDYTNSNGVITAPQLVSTLMFCESPAGLMDMETGFSNTVAEGAVYTLEGDVLTITSADGQQVFMYTVPSIIAQ